LKKELSKTKNARSLKKKKKEALEEKNSSTAGSVLNSASGVYKTKLKTGARGENLRGAITETKLQKEGGSSQQQQKKRNIMNLRETHAKHRRRQNQVER